MKRRFRTFLFAASLLMGLFDSAHAAVSNFKTSFLAQTGNIATTTIYTPTAVKDCTISVYITASGFDLNPPINGVTWQWTDDFGSPQGATSYGVFQVHMLANTSLTFALDAGTMTATYNVYITGHCQ